MLSDDDRRKAAELLGEAERTQSAIDPLTELFPGIDVVDAYEIQLHQHPSRLGSRRTGPRPQGRPVVQGDAADDGRRRARLRPPARRHVRLEGGRVPRGRATCCPRVEVEVAFVLGADLRGPGCTVDDVLRATDCVAPGDRDRSTAASPTGRSASPTPSPTTPRRPGSCSAERRRAGRASTSRRSTAALRLNGEMVARPASRRRARQPGHRRRLAGQQGPRLRRHASRPAT